MKLKTDCIQIKQAGLTWNICFYFTRGVTCACWRSVGILPHSKDVLIIGYDWAGSSLNAFVIFLDNFVSYCLLRQFQEIENYIMHNLSRFHQTQNNQWLWLFEFGKIYHWKKSCWAYQKMYKTECCQAILSDIWYLSVLLRLISILPILLCLLVLWISSEYRTYFFVLTMRHNLCFFGKYKYRKQAKRKQAAQWNWQVLLNDFRLANETHFNRHYRS